MRRKEDATSRLICADCGMESDEVARGWRGYLAAENFSDHDEVIVFCPSCAERVDTGD
jgi:hypothetical protein